MPSIEDTPGTAAYEALHPEPPALRPEPDRLNARNVDVTVEPIVHEDGRPDGRMRIVVVDPTINRAIWSTVLRP